jgi:hypothetical protein
MTCHRQRAGHCQPAGAQCYSQPKRDPIVSSVLAGPCCSQSKWNPIVSRGRVGPPCSSQPIWDPVASGGRAGLVDWEKRRGPGAALEKAPPPRSQPELPKADFSYRAATVPASLSRNSLSTL